MSEPVQRVIVEAFDKAGGTSGEKIYVVRQVTNFFPDKDQLTLQELKELFGQGVQVTIRQPK